MTFLNPLLLYGLGAIAVPILIHLLMQRRIRHIAWGAMRFLEKAVQKNRKQMNLEDLLLLLLRCLLVLFLALALARPALRKAGIGLLGTGGETAVIALDNSYSMSQTDGVTSRFEKAQKAAEQVVDGLPSGSSVAVLLVADEVDAPISRPTNDLNLVRKVVRESKRSDRATELEPGFRQAVEILKQSGGGSKTLYFITDGQAIGWKKLSEIRSMLDAVKTSVKTRLVLVGDKEEHNLGVTSLRLGSAMSPANEALRFVAEVTNFGTTDARNVQVGISVDAEKSSDEGSIDLIPAGASKSISLFAKCRDEGFHSITARVPEDRMPADDQWTIALNALKEISVLVVDGDPGSEPRDSETFYFTNALTPVSPPAQKDYFIKTKKIRPGELDGTKLGDCEAVVLANVADVSATVVGALENYVRRGGGLIVFPGDKINASFYNSNLVKSGVLPASFGGLRGKAGQQETFFTLQDDKYNHSIVSIWKDPANGNLATAHFYAAFALNPEKSPAKESGQPIVVLRYSDGAPAVVEHTLGLGRVIQFSSSADLAWNDMALRPSYVPLIHRTLGALLSRREERLNVPVGGKFAWPCEAELVGKDAKIIKPGAEKTGGDVRRITMVKGVPMIQYTDTDLSGAYSVLIGGESKAKIKFAAQADREESKLADVSPAELSSFGPAVQVVQWSPGRNLRDALVHERSGTELWQWFATLALAVAVAETALAHRFSKAK